MTVEWETQRQTILLEPGGLSVPPGSRVAYMFEGDAERARFARFIASGLADRDKCLIVTDEGGRELFSTALDTLGLDREGHEREGSLVILTEPVQFSSMQELAQPILEDARDRFRLLRCINDTSWMSAKGWKADQFMRFEMMGHMLAHGYRSLAICQYDTLAVDHRYINQLISSHQFTVVSPRVERNPDHRLHGQIIFDGMGEQLLALRRLQDLSLKLAASIGPGDILDAIIEAAMTICGATKAAISYINSAGELRVLRRRGLSEEYIDRQQASRPDPAQARLSAAKRPVIIEDLAELADASPYYEAWRREGISSIVSLPLVSEGEVLGVIEVGSAGARYYTPTDTDALSILAAQASAALVSARLFEQLREANQAKDDFLATLSHELRTPLTPILGWVHMLKRFAGMDPLLARGLETVERNTNQLSVLINELLDMTRVTSGKIELVFMPTDLASLVQSSADLIRPQAEARQISITADLPAGPLITKVDPVRMHQVLTNLLNNAVKFTPEGGRVSISLGAEEDSGDPTIEVADTGIGIDPQFLPHVFERFTQAHGGMNRRFGGLGLGLAIARALVEMHGGSITASSKGLGFGTAFTVRLPGAAYESAVDVGREPQQDVETARPLGLRVLVVEDSADTLDMLEKWLGSFGCEVSAAANAVEGIKRARESPPDLIISDIGLPEIDGYELMRRLRQMPGLEKVPGIALTGYAHDEDRDLALAAGYDAHLAKPAEMRVLLSLIKRLVAEDQGPRIKDSGLADQED